MNQPKLTTSKLAAIAIVIGIVLFSSCGQLPNVGVKKDMSSGMTTTYKAIELDKAMLIMNDEEIHHNDIPLGESFFVVNQDIKGLAEKEGKVSVGCELNITDQKGNKILEVADLFQGKDVFNKDEVTSLRCKVNTGDPMKSGEKYDVEVLFWDKYGPGKIVNKITIRMIDAP